MPNEENMFDFLSDDPKPVDEAPEKDASAEPEMKEPEKAEESVKDEPEAEEKKDEPKSDFDYSDIIDTMESDAKISDDESESEDDDGENDSADKGKEAPEKDSGKPQSDQPTQMQMFEAAKAGLTIEEVQGLNARELATAVRIATRLKPADPKDPKDEPKEEEALFTPIAIEGLDDFDDDTQSLVKGLQTQFNENMQKMADKLESAQEVLGQSQEQSAQQGQAQFFEWFDTEVSRLGEDWNDVFGADPNELEKGSPEVGNRVKLIEEMDKLAIAHPEFDKKKLFESSMQLMFSTEMKDKQEQAKKTTRKKHRNDRSTAKPTQRNRSIENMPDGREKALASVKDIGKKKKWFNLF